MFIPALEKPKDRNSSDIGIKYISDKLIKLIIIKKQRKKTSFAIY